MSVYIVLLFGKVISVKGEMKWYTAFEIRSLNLKSYDRLNRINSLFVGGLLLCIGVNYFSAKVKHLRNK